MTSLAPPILTPATRSDADLLAAAARGDAAAFGDLVRRHIDWVYAAAVRLSGDRHAADDITQAVFLVLHKKAGRIHPAALPAWLHQTTCYAAANARRIARRRVRHERAAARPELTMPEPSPRADTQSDSLDRAIDSLNEKDRRLVVDRYLRGLDLTAVAAARGTSPAAAQKRLERALDKLRTHLGRRSGAGLVTPAVVAAAVLAAAPSSSPAAPPSLVSAVTTSTATPAAAALATAVLNAVHGAALTTLAVAALATAVVGVAVPVIRYVGGPQASAPSVPTSRPGVASPDAAPAAVPFGQLRSGLTVALVGVSASPSATQPWWRADGSPLPAAPYANAGGTVGEVPSGRLARQFAVRFDYPSAALTAESIQVAVAGSDGDSASFAVDKFGRAIPGLVGDAADVPDRPVTLRFNVATGPWNVLRQLPATGTGAADNHDLAVGPAHAGTGIDAGDAVVDVTTLDAIVPAGQTRLVAIDIAGTEHVGVRRHIDTDPSTPTTKIWHADYAFPGLRAANVRTLSYRARPFDAWVEFRNVAVHAGQATTVAVVTSDDPAAGGTR